jgi:hypothetical protein
MVLSISGLIYHCSQYLSMSLSTFLWALEERWAFMAAALVERIAIMVSFDVIIYITLGVDGTMGIHGSVGGTYFDIFPCPYLLTFGRWWNDVQLLLSWLNVLGSYIFIAIMKSFHVIIYLPLCVGGTMCSYGTVG